MRKILAVLFCLIFIFSFTACGEKEKKKTEHSVDIEYYAKAGQMPEVNYALGSDVEKVKNELSAEAEKSESVYSVTEGESTVLIDNGEICYYYKKSNPEKGIDYIVNYGTAFGFPIGSVTVEVKEALDGYSYTEEVLNEENAFFMFDTENGSVIKCRFEDNTVLFVFKDNALCATALLSEHE